MAKVVDRRPNGAVLVEVSAEDAHDLEVGADVEVHRSRANVTRDWPQPFGALAGTLPKLEIDDIKAARRAALHGKTRRRPRVPDTRTDNEIRELSPKEWDQLVDEKARKLLGMSGEEFERRLNAGEIDIDDSPDVTRVAMMLPLRTTRK
jgi:hypothetical protein